MKRAPISCSILVVALPLLLPAAPALSAWPPLFRGAELYDAGTWTASSTHRGGALGTVAVGDMNGDGLPDLVATNTWNEVVTPGSTVAVLLHASTSEALALFQPRVNYPAGMRPGGAALGDMNQDGHLDVVVSGEQDSVTILLGDGAGGLGPPTVFVAGTQRLLGTLLVADVSNDGRLDVILATRGTTSGILVMLGGGNGTLGPATFHGVSGTGRVYAIAVGDVTQDGAVDVVAVGDVMNVAIFRGNNTGSFTHTGSLPLPGMYSLSVAIGRINADAIPDIVAGNADTGGVVVYLGTGGGLFGPLAQYTFNGALSGIELVELDGSGDDVLDIVGWIPTGRESRHCVVVLRGNGNGTFGPQTYYPAMAGIGDVRLADVDMDGIADVVGAQAYSDVTSRVHSVCVLRGDGTGGFESAFWNLEGKTPTREALADFNLDGRNDIAFSDASSIGIALGNGNGTFQYILGGNVPSPAPDMIVSGEWNGDARPDIAFQHGSNVVGWFGVGTGGFSFVTFSIPGQVLQSRSVGDMNRDGRQDLVLITGGAASTFRVFTQGVDGFTWTANAPQTAGSTILSLALGDWNRDGILDVATAMSLGVSVFRGVGNGALQPEQTVTIGRAYQDVCAGDFNRDGKLDLAAIELIAGQSGDRGITVFPGDGLGGFGAPTSMPTFEQNGVQIASWDVDIDGKPDLISTGVADQSHFIPFSARPGVMEVHVGDGNGGFTSRSAHALGSQNGRILPGDMNRDDAPDVITTGITACSTFVGDCTSFQTLFATPPDRPYWLESRVDYAMSTGSNRVAVGDVNRDGIPDVVTSSPSSQVTVRLGMASGTLGLPATVPSSLSARQVGLGDINRDGVLDLVTSRSGLGAPDGISCMFGVGDGTFGPRLDHPIADANDLAIGDMNKDGFLDLVVAQPSFSGSVVTTLLWRGDGIFTPMPSATVPYVYDLDLVDFDRDGDLDVVVAGGAFYIMFGNGNGTLDNSLMRNVGTTSIQSVCVADFNRDGYPDVALSDITATVRVAWGATQFTTYVVSSMVTSALDVQVGPAQADGRQFLYMATYENRLFLLEPGSVAGTFTVAVSLPTGGNPEALALTDLDRDGLLDVVAVNASDGSASVFLHADSPVTGVERVSRPGVPAVRLEQNYPNPFNPATAVRFSLRDAGPVRLRVFDVQGRMVATLLDGVALAGEHVVTWDGRRGDAATAASGVYFYRLEAAGEVETRKMVIAK